MAERNTCLLVAMARKGWTSRQLADATGLAESTISLTLNNNTKPRYASRLRIAGALNVLVHELFPTPTPKTEGVDHV